MGKKPPLTICLLWIIALQSSNGQQSANFHFPNSASTQQAVPLDERFKIPPVTQDDRFDPMISEWVAGSVMNFAHDLGVALDQGNYPNTEIFSPLSIMSALSLLELGSNGNSYRQLMSTLFPFIGGDSSQKTWKVHEEFGWLLEDLLLNEKNPRRPRDEGAWRRTPFNPSGYGTGGNNTPDEHTLRIANGLFVQQDFSLRPDYKTATQSVYKSEVMSMDFRGRSEYAKHFINSWINQNTLGKIPAIITDEVSRDTSIIIASALYFKGFWEQPFLPAGTGQADFFPDGEQESKSAVKVTMMGVGGVFPFYDAPEYDCRIIGLPYKGNQTTMYVILPNRSTRRKLNDLQKLLTGDKINEMIRKMEQRTAVIAFPKFHVTSMLNLKKPLRKMGIEDIFISGQSDLSLITDAGQYLPQEAPPVLSLALPPGASFTRNPQDPPSGISLALPPGASFTRNPPLAHVPVTRTPVIRQESSPIAFQTPILSNPQTTQSFEASQRPLDRFQEEPLIFSRFNNTEQVTRPVQQSHMQWSQQGDLLTGKVQQRNRRSVTYKVESEFMRSSLPLRLKDLILSKRITKSNHGKKLTRSRRQAEPALAVSLQNLDRLRQVPGLRRPQLFVDDVLHKVDFEVNEQGTEAAAATLTWLRRSGTDVAFRCDTPFIILIRHDPTLLPLFYGKINIPV